MHTQELNLPQFKLFLKGKIEGSDNRGMGHVLTLLALVNQVIYYVPGYSAQHIDLLTDLGLPFEVVGYAGRLSQKSYPPKEIQLIDGGGTLPKGFQNTTQRDVVNTVNFWLESMKDPRKVKIGY